MNTVLLDWFGRFVNHWFNVDIRVFIVIVDIYVNYIRTIVILFNILGHWKIMLNLSFWVKISNGFDGLNVSFLFKLFYNCVWTKALVNNTSEELERFILFVIWVKFLFELIFMIKWLCVEKVIKVFKFCDCLDAVVLFLLHFWFTFVFV